MAESKINNPDVRAKLFKEAKNKPIAFAVCVGKTPDDTAVALHKTLGAKQVFTQLKSECKLVKGAWGTLTVAGKIATFECEKSVKGLEKKLKLYLKAESLPFRPNVVGVEPDEDDEEGVEEEAAAAPPARASADDAAPAEAPAKAAPSAAPILAALNKMTPAIKAAVAANPDGRGAIVAAVAAVKQHVEADDAAAAKTALLELGAILKSGAPGGTGTPAAGGAGAAVDLPKVLITWRSASESVDSQVSSLQAALRGTNDADFERIAEFGLNGITGNHRVKLRAALMGLERASDDTRPALAKAARSAVAGFRGFIASDDVVGLVDENPFVSTTIQRTLGDALGALEESLANVA